MSLRRKIQFAGVVVWATVIAVGMAKLDAYDNTPGPTQKSPSKWPDNTRLSLTRDRLTLIVFVHPQCSCTRATLSQLEELLARQEPWLSVTVVAVLPDSGRTDWAASQVLRKAIAIPGIRVMSDVGGKEAARFHAMTSGYALAYDGRGELQFSGGLTAARGEEGDSFGVDALHRILAHESNLQREVPVFGCQLGRMVR